MAKVGRKPLAIPRIRIPVFIRMDLAAELELLLLDPMRNKVKYGERTRYFEALVETDLNLRRRTEGKPKFESELTRFIRELRALRMWTPESIEALISKYEVDDAPSGDGDTSGEGDQPEDPTGSSAGSALDSGRSG